MFAVCSAGATELPVQGGPGGGDFRSECARDPATGKQDFVAGIYARSGLWIDAIGIQCGSQLRSGNLQTPPYNKPYHGGNGGGLDNRGTCPSTHFVSGIMFNLTVRGTRFVKFVQVACSPIGTGSLVNLCIDNGTDSPCAAVDYFFAPRQIVPAKVQNCPVGEAAIGIRGRAGQFVDALGLICGPKPSTRPVRRLGRLRFVTAVDDVDMYEGPGVAKIGDATVFLRQGTRAQSLRRDPGGGWCLLKGVAPGGRDAYVAEDHLTPRNCAF
jgi:hypothetical protein